MFENTIDFGFSCGLPASLIPPPCQTINLLVNVLEFIEINDRKNLLSPNHI